MVFCNKRIGDGAALTHHLDKQEVVHWPYSAVQSNSSDGSFDKQVQGSSPQCE